MGIFRTLRGIVNSEVMGEEIVKKIIDIFNETRMYSPGDDRHELLAKTYISRLVALGKNVNEETIALESMSQTHIFTLLPEGKDIKAMALHLLNQERPDIIQAYPKFGLEYIRLMESVLTSDS